MEIDLTIIDQMWLMRYVINFETKYHPLHPEIQSNNKRFYRHAYKSECSISISILVALDSPWQTSGFSQNFLINLDMFLFVILLGTYGNHDLKLHRRYLWSVASKTSFGEGGFTWNTKTQHNLLPWTQKPRNHVQILHEVSS